MAAPRVSATLRAYTRGPWRPMAVAGPAPGPGARSLAVMAPSVRIARPGDGAGIARVWLDTSAYYAELDPGHFKVPDAHGLAELTDGQLGMPDERALSLVAEVDGRLVGWLSARLELPHHHAARQFVREHDWTRLLVDALIVERDQWRRGIGTTLLEAAESWGRAHGAQVARLDTYAQGPVSVPFYEQHMGYQRRSIVFQKQL
jgi:GNAT superfamily N-acetyltransferase